MGAPIGIYIHIPYCRVLCPYCDFVKKRTSGDVPDTFVESLCAEIEQYRGPTDVASVFFGGGTPSLLTPEGMEQIFDTLHSRFTFIDAEITIEVNPDDVSAEQLAVWKRVGVNRLSLGVQSFDDEVLAFLGRNHDSIKAHAACALIAETFDNWSLDLIFGVKPVESWVASVHAALGYAPQHISSYGLTYEENTPFWQQRHQAVDDDISLEQYRLTHALLADYNHYEVSNFALPGYESKHNAIYWRNEEYVGFGPGAVSYLDSVRVTNPLSISGYESAPGLNRDEDRVDADAIRLETLIQHFRTVEGITESYYRTRFGTELRDDFGRALSELSNRGLIAHDASAGVYRPTLAGYELNNEIGLALIPE
jgi:oxygen-independent coproporphyrinogen III oxidase